MSRAKTAGRAAAIPDTYFALVKRHPLTSIRSERELDDAQAVLDGLLREDLDDGRLAYLDALSDLVIVYEQEHHAIAPLPPHELLAHMLQERSMSQADLTRTTGLAKATVSDLVTGNVRTARKAGGSQGGALTLITSGLDPRVTPVAPNVAAMCDHSGMASTSPASSRAKRSTAPASLTRCAPPALFTPRSAFIRGRR
jgi:antitoxin component HigA of HigAB toxin-antitoxin module